MSSGSIAYQQLMKTGFPNHMDVEDLFNSFKTNKDFDENTYANKKKYCSMLLRSCQLKRIDFQIANSKIFFRNGKLEILTEALKKPTNDILLRFNKLKVARSKWNIALIATRFVSMGKKIQCDADFTVEDIGLNKNEFNGKDIDVKKKLKKKRKLDTQKDHHNSTSKKQMGISSEYF